MDHQKRLVDLLGVKEGRDLHVGIGRLPQRSSLALEPERGEAAVERPRARDAGPEQIRVRQEIGGHERPVRVAGDPDAVARIERLVKCVDVLELKDEIDAAVEAIYDPLGRFRAYLRSDELYPGETP